MAARKPRKGFATMTVQQFRDTVSEKDGVLFHAKRLLSENGWLWTHTPDSREIQGPPGVPDIIAVHEATGAICVIECKAVWGRVHVTQKQWADAFSRNGHIRVFRCIKMADIDNGSFGAYAANPQLRHTQEERVA